MKKFLMALLSVLCVFAMAGCEGPEVERENMQAEIMRFEDMKFTQNHCDLYAENEWLKASIRQSLNSTAQTALEEFICRLVNSRLVSTKSDLYVEMLEAKDDLLKEKYGVE